MELCLFQTRERLFCRFENGQIVSKLAISVKPKKYYSQALQFDPIDFFAVYNWIISRDNGRYFEYFIRRHRLATSFAFSNVFFLSLFFSPLFSLSERNKTTIQDFSFSSRYIFFIFFFFFFSFFSYFFEFLANRKFFLSPSRKRRRRKLFAQQASLPFT